MSSPLQRAEQHLRDAVRKMNQPNIQTAVVDSVTRGDGYVVTQATIRLSDQATGIPVSGLPPGEGLDAGTRVRVAVQGPPSNRVYRYLGLDVDSSQEAAGAYDPYAELPPPINIRAVSYAYQSGGQTCFIDVFFDSPVSLQAEFVCQFRIDDDPSGNWSESGISLVTSSGQRYIRLQQAQVGSSYSIKVATKLPGLRQSRYSDAISIVAGSSSIIPDPPVDLSATDFGQFIRLAWTPLPNQDILGYAVYAATNNQGANATRITQTNQPIGTADVTDFTKWYAIKVVTMSGEESATYSNWVKDTNPPLAPPAWALIDAGFGQLVLVWLPSPSPDVAQYEILKSSTSYRPTSVGEMTRVVLTGNVTSHTVLAPQGEQAWFGVRAIDKAGNIGTDMATHVLLTPERIDIPSISGKVPTIPVLIDVVIEPDLPAGAVGQATELKFTVSWSKSTFYDTNGIPTLDRAGYEALIDIGNMQLPGWKAATNDDIQSTTIRSVPPAGDPADNSLYATVRVRARDGEGITSAWSEPILISRAQAYRDLVPPSGSPTNLQWSFLSPDLSLTWQYLQARPSDFAGYVVSIFSDSSASRLYREISVPSEQCVYSWSQNVQDSSPYGLDNGDPSLFVRVCAIDVFGNRSSAASVLATNLAPGTVTNYDLTAAFQMVTSRWSRLAEPDVRYYNLQISSASSFAPEFTTDYFVDGETGSHTIIADAATIFWGRVRAFDWFGQVSSAWSNVDAGETYVFRDVQPQKPSQVTFVDQGLDIDNTGTSQPWFRLTWLRNSEPDISHYNIRAKISHLGEEFWRTWTVNQSSASSTSVTSVVSGGLVSGATYVYGVEAVSATGLHSSYTTSASFVLFGDTIAPDPPGLVASALHTTVYVTIAPPTNVDLKNFVIYRSTTNDFSTAASVAQIDGTLYVDNRTTQFDTTFYYWARTVDHSGNVSAQSSVASATTAKIAGTFIDTITANQISTGVLTSAMTVSGSIATSSDINQSRAIIDTNGIRLYTQQLSGAAIPTLQLFTQPQSVYEADTIALLGRADLTESQTIRILRDGTIKVPGQLIASGIKGDAITAGRIATQRLSVAALSFLLKSIVFNTASTTTLSWSAGTIQFADPEVPSYFINAGSVEVGSSRVYLYWTIGAATFSSTTDEAVALADGRIVIGSALPSVSGRPIAWSPANNQGTIVSGDYIRTGAINLSYGAIVQAPGTGSAATTMTHEGIFGYSSSGANTYSLKNDGTLAFGKNNAFVMDALGNITISISPTTNFSIVSSSGFGEMRINSFGLSLANSDKQIIFQVNPEIPNVGFGRSGDIIDDLGIAFSQWASIIGPRPEIRFGQSPNQAGAIIDAHHGSDSGSNGHGLRILSPQHSGVNLLLEFVVGADSNYQLTTMPYPVSSRLARFAALAPSPSYGRLELSARHHTGNTSTDLTIDWNKITATNLFQQQGTLRVAGNTVVDAGSGLELRFASTSGSIISATRDQNGNLTDLENLRLVAETITLDQTDRVSVTGALETGGLVRVMGSAPSIWSSAQTWTSGMGIELFVVGDQAYLLAGERTSASVFTPRKLNLLTGIADFQSLFRVSATSDPSLFSGKGLEFSFVQSVSSGYVVSWDRSSASSSPDAPQPLTFIGSHIVIDGRPKVTVGGGNTGTLAFFNGTGTSRFPILLGSRSDMSATGPINRILNYLVSLGLIQSNETTI